MTIEIDAIEPSPHSGGAHGYAIDGPRPGDRPDGDGFEIDGWVLGRGGPVGAIEVALGDEIRCRVPVARERPDVAAAYAEQPWAAGAGFRGWVPTLGLPASFVLDIRGLLADGDQAPLAKLRGHHAADDFSMAATDAEGWRGPDFIVIGAQRSGSTSLYRYLTQHPLVAPAATKEVKYFSYFHDRPWGWYRRQFPPTLPPNGLTGEATPYYLFHPHAARRIREQAPNARLITVLRNPVDRAYSHYLHERRRGTEFLSFEEALAREDSRLSGEEAKMVADEGYASLAHQNFSYQARGRYAEQLRRWLAHVPRDRLLVVRSEDLYADPVAALDEVTTFLDLPPVALTEAVPHNQARYPPMRRQTRTDLEAEFASSNDDLRQMLGDRFTWTGAGST